MKLEMAEGAYQSPEDALLAGLRVMRENRSSRAELARRIESLSDGSAIILDGGEAFGEFLDSIDAEIDAELQP